MSGFQTARSQNPALDSIIQALNVCREDTNKVKLLNELSALRLNRGMSAEAIQSASDARILSEKLGYLTGQVKAHLNLAVAHRTKGNYPESVKNLISLLKLQEKRKDRKGQALAYNMLGIVYNNQANYEEALRNHMRALQIRKELDLPQEVAGSYNNIGLVYYQQYKFTDAMKNFSMALEIVKDSENKKLLSSVYSNMANVYEEQDSLEEALKFYNMANSLRDQANAVANMSYYAKIGHLMLRKKNYKESRRFILLSLEISKRLQNKEYISFAYEDLEKLSKQEKDYVSAYKYRILYDTYRDSLLNQENREKTLAMKLQYDFEKKTEADSLKNVQAAQIERLHHEQVLHRQQMYIVGMIIGLGLMLAVVITSVRAYNLKRKANALISKQKHMVEIKQKEIIDSIQYAHRIQLALLPSEKYIERALERMREPDKNSKSD